MKSKLYEITVNGQIVYSELSKASKTPKQVTDTYWSVTKALSVVHSDATVSLLVDLKLTTHNVKSDFSGSRISTM